MRTLKFRQPRLDKDGKFIDWFYWGFLDDGSGLHFVAPLRHDVENYQFTGLHDKNGKEGYFDDLLKDDDGHIGIVKWSEKKLRVYFEWNDGRISYPADVYDYIGFEFIGNIYEHPGLIEKEK